MKYVIPLFTNLNLINKETQNNVICNINCKDLPGCYVGESKQCLRKRIRNHKNSINNLGLGTALTKVLL